MNEQVIVTGASGFVGRRIVKALLERGVGVRLLVRDPARAAALFPARGVELVEIEDLFTASVETLQTALAGGGMLVHAAWYAEPGQYLDSTRNLVCLTGSLHLAEAFVAAGGRRFVGVGSCAEYDPTPGHLGIHTPLRPQTLYGACKASTYQVLEQLLPGAGVEFAWCRPFYLYGEGEDPRRLVAYLHARLAAGLPVDLGSGEQVRDYLDVERAGEMIAEVALGGRCGAFNICSGRGQSVRQIAERVADGYGRRDLLRFGARPDNPQDPPCIIGVLDET
ncbi:NAD(P)-dependent oxidoreductase [Marichromatium gracile]|uniref:NAD-dependent epimerase/dehydratase family protein n=1 Tax=Marichromatium gracile TaxID=1048 RepID=UPI001F1C4209|nr:NAD(P)-dependent oxidoreductase [Marichromatium gracile]MCF1183975.1 NAD(P)-dependent oxidoreductase [Marichromatium gracile]